MRNIVLISHTALDAPGGVPRWNRDFVAGFPGTRHFSWDDAVRANPSFGRQFVSEWDKAQITGTFLVWGKCVKKDDIVIADGFWGEALSSMGYDVISVAHGIWSHLTAEDVAAGKKPEFPVEHSLQVKHRRDHITRGGKIVAVSQFIADQMNLQWGFESEVINNCVDTRRFSPPSSPLALERPLVIHGVTTNNKGFDHIRAVEGALSGIADVMVLDRAAEFLKMDKYEALGHASMVVQPSAYEGNSYFVLETLACGVPIVAYKVGLLYSVSRECKSKGMHCCVGCLIERDKRSPEETARVAKFILESVTRERSVYNPRQVAEQYPLERFHREWKDYLQRYEDLLESR